MLPPWQIKKVFYQQLGLSYYSIRLVWLGGTYRNPSKDRASCQRNMCSLSKLLKRTNWKGFYWNLFWKMKWTYSTYMIFLFLSYQKYVLLSLKSDVYAWRYFHEVNVSECLIVWWYISKNEKILTKSQIFLRTSWFMFWNNCFVCSSISKQTLYIYTCSSREQNQRKSKLSWL